jgi:predicted dehydrogenase
VALIGAGFISQMLFEAMDRQSDLRLASVCDLDASKLATYRQIGVPTTSSVDVALHHPAVDAVVVCTPPDTHYEIVRAALDAGKHVCCEKPLATSATDARRLVESAEAANRTLFSLFHRRYNRNLRDVEHAKHALVGVTASYLEDIREHAGGATWYWSPATHGGGCIADNGPNVFDVLRTMVGTPILVAASVWRQGSVDVRAIIDCRTPDGVPVEIQLDWLHAGPERKSITLNYADGRYRVLDMLAGFERFKSSLRHEYEAALRDFRGRINASDGPPPLDESGLAAAEWVDEVCAIAHAVPTKLHHERHLAGTV